MTNLTDILAALPHLQPHERQQLRKALDVLNGHAPLEPPNLAQRIPRQELTADQHRVLEALRRFMKRRGAEMVVMSQLRTDTEFQDKVTALFAFIHKITTNRQEEAAMLSLGFDLVYDDMVARGSKLNELRTVATAQAILNRIDRIPALINRQFPGYAAAGVLKWIFKKDVTDNEKSADQG